jgi:hypothetical protein
MALLGKENAEVLLRDRNATAEESSWFAERAAQNKLDEEP